MRTVKLLMSLGALVAALGACTTEVPVRMERKCEKIVEAAWVQEYRLGIFARPLLSYRVVTDSGRKMLFYEGDNSWNGPPDLSLTVGSLYCVTEYVPIKK